MMLSVKDLFPSFPRPTGGNMAECLMAADTRIGMLGKPSVFGKQIIQFPCLRRK